MTLFAYCAILAFEAAGVSATATYVVALFDYTARQTGDATFAAGDIIELSDDGDADAVWWSGTPPTGRVGLFPAVLVAHKNSLAAEPCDLFSVHLIC